MQFIRINIKNVAPWKIDCDQIFCSLTQVAAVSTEQCNVIYHVSLGIETPLKITILAISHDDFRGML
jgi:hypothetical protein